MSEGIRIVNEKSRKKSRKNEVVFWRYEKGI